MRPSGKAWDLLVLLACSVISRAGRPISTDDAAIQAPSDCRLQSWWQLFAGQRQQPCNRAAISVTELNGVRSSTPRRTLAAAAYTINDRSGAHLEGSGDHPGRPTVQLAARYWLFADCVQIDT